jgi:hypothetical protein
VGWSARTRAGLAGAVLLPVVGCSVGAAQVVRGIYNTPEAVTESMSGKRWDQRKRDWVQDNLVDDAVHLTDIDDEDMFVLSFPRLPAPCTVGSTASHGCVRRLRRASRLSQLRGGTSEGGGRKARGGRRAERRCTRHQLLRDFGRGDHCVRRGDQASVLPARSPAGSCCASQPVHTNSHARVVNAQRLFTPLAPQNVYSLTGPTHPLRSASAHADVTRIGGAMAPPQTVLSTKLRGYGGVRVG